MVGSNDKEIIKIISKYTGTTSPSQAGECNGNLFQQSEGKTEEIMFNSLMSLRTCVFGVFMRMPPVISHANF